jgi:hypothetical protein
MVQLEQKKLYAKRDRHPDPVEIYKKRTLLTSSGADDKKERIRWKAPKDNYVFCSKMRLRNDVEDQIVKSIILST